MILKNIKIFNEKNWINVFLISWMEVYIMGENVLICLCGLVNSINISYYIIELKLKFDEVNVIVLINGRKFINGEILK